jgi:F-type H+-transporting ATPase subunit b
MMTFKATEKFKLKVFLPVFSLLALLFILSAPMAQASKSAAESAKGTISTEERVTTVAAEAEAPTEEAHEEAASGGVVGALGINWKLFVAQLVNFGIILLVLWKWVLTPVAKKLGERSEKVQKSLDDAQRIEKEKQEFRAWKDQEMGKARKEASSIVTMAQSEAVAVKNQILQDAKLEQEKLVKQIQAQIQSEKQQALSDIKTQVADMITGAAEKILRKNLDEKADRELIKESLKSIK